MTDSTAGATTPPAGTSDDVATAPAEQAAIPEQAGPPAGESISQSERSEVKETPVLEEQTEDSSTTVNRQAKLRLTQIDPLSVMKASFLLSVAAGVIAVVAVGVVWSVLGAAGLWDSVNEIVTNTLTADNQTFRIEDYLGTSRILGFTMLVAVVNVVLLTAIATVTAFLYNLAATLVGGIEVTFTEER